MNILILGSGGREHALAWKMAASPLTDKLYCAPGNAGIAQEAECVLLDIGDHAAVIAFCKEKKVDFVVVGPEVPLCAGIVDDLEGAGIKAFGPTKWAARLEGSKGFTKDLCKANDIPTAAYERFKSAGPAKDYVRKTGAPIVVKADGLAAGKGVVVAESVQEAEAAIDMMFGGGLGTPAWEIVIEECLVGEEASFATLLTRALRLLVYVMVPITALTVIVRQPVVEILFGSGKISQPNLDLIASTLAYFAIGLTAHALIAVLARGFYARQDTVTPVLAAVAAVAINCSLAVVLVGPYGLQGIAVAIAVAAWIEALALLAILHHRLPHFELRGLARVGIEAIVGSALAGAVAFLASEWLTNALGIHPGRLVLVGVVILVSLVFSLVYAALSLVLRIPELPSIVGVMADVLRRPARS